MKKKILFFLLLLISCCSFAQTENIAGKWEGVLVINTSPFNNFKSERVLNFTVQLNQNENVVWGVYSNGESVAFDSCECAGKLTSKLSKKSNSSIMIYYDGVVSHNKIPVDICNSLHYLQANYTKEGEEEFLTGKWYTSQPNGLADDGASGSFILQRINTVADIDVDQYFPRLAQLIKRFKAE
jgi:hypothetical protein